MSLSSSRLEVFSAASGTRVKICGVTNQGDAETAIAAGADALGINLFPGSKRFVELDAVRGWVGDLPVARIAVVVNPLAEEVLRIAEAGVFDAIQFHGDETPDFCAAATLPWWRAVRVSGPQALDAALLYTAEVFLLDAFAAAGYGGTGAAVDLDLAAGFVRDHAPRRVLLAGGLQPGTAAEAVRRVRPFGVDVASGVETAGDPRRKDPDRVRQFIEQAKSALCDSGGRD